MGDQEQREQEPVEQVENDPVEGSQGEQVPAQSGGFDPNAPVRTSPPDPTDQSGEGFQQPEGQQQATPHPEGSATDPARTDALGIERPEDDDKGDDADGEPQEQDGEGETPAPAE